LEKSVLHAWGADKQDKGENISYKEHKYFESVEWELNVPEGFCFEVYSKIE